MDKLKNLPGDGEKIQRLVEIGSCYHPQGWRENVKV